jgi:hypothetical protein
MASRWWHRVLASSSSLCLEAASRCSFTPSVANPCGADLVIIVGAQYVRFVFYSFLVFRVLMLLFPLGGMKLWVASVADDSGFFFWDTTSRGWQQLSPVVGWLTGGSGCLFPSYPL